MMMVALQLTSKNGSGWHGLWGRPAIPLRGGIPCPVDVGCQCYGCIRATVFGILGRFDVPLFNPVSGQPLNL